MPSVVKEPFMTPSILTLPLTPSLISTSPSIYDTSIPFPFNPVMAPTYINPTVFDVIIEPVI